MGDRPATWKASRAWAKACPERSRRDGAAVYVFFVGQVERFVWQKDFRGWSGMVPRSDQSGDVEKKGLPITKAGPDLVKKYAYINAEVARQWDPQIAAIYDDQMVHKGKHHVQAVCHCATPVGPGAGRIAGRAVL